MPRRGQATLRSRRGHDAQDAEDRHDARNRHEAPGGDSDGAASTRNHAAPAGRFDPKRRLDDYDPGNTLMLTARYGLSALMHVVVVGYVIHMMWIGGVLDIVKSFLDVRFAAPCGALADNEYVVISRNIVNGNAMAGGAFHVRGGLIGGTYLGRGNRHAELNRTLVLSILSPNNPDITVLDFGDSVVGPGTLHDT